jgi:hypothetical protein
MGATEGAIMPIIMTTHMTNTNANSINPQGAVRRRHESQTGRNHAKLGHVHAAHVYVDREPKHIAPGQRGDHAERTRNEQAISPQ